MIRPFTKLFVASALSVLSICTAAAQENYGYYIGRVRAEWLENGRDMRLLESFAYVDPHGTRWDAQAGAVVDGASIPQSAWSLIGGPFEGKYREASVIHDVACVQKNRDWKAVHMAFFTAMLASGVSSIRAKIMYAAVYHFGPRWQEVRVIRGLTATDADRAAETIQKAPPKDADVQVSRVQDRDPAGNVSDSLKIVLTPKISPLNNADFGQLRNRIERENLSLEQIEDFKPGN